MNYNGSNMNELHKIVAQMTSRGKGILAADESNSTAGKRLDSIDVESTEENRRRFRELFIRTPDAEKYMSGVILYDETIRQSDSNGKLFPQVLIDHGVIPGIKVDLGKDPDEHSPDETTTKGLEGLEDRLKEYYNLGARFAKWRAVILISDDGDLPSTHNIQEECEVLAKYASKCQAAGIVPIVEPEVVLTGNHSIERAEEVTTLTLNTLFYELKKLNIDLAGTILKTSMVVAGSEAEKASPKEVAEATVRTLNHTVPEELGGVVFLSGGQGPDEATENLNAIAKLGPHPWPVTFSYARALQNTTLQIWKGDDTNIEAAQAEFITRLENNSKASLGKF